MPDRLHEQGGSRGLPVIFFTETLQSRFLFHGFYPNHIHAGSHLQLNKKTKI